MATDAKGARERRATGRVLQRRRRAGASAASPGQQDRKRDPAAVDQEVDRVRVPALDEALVPLVAGGVEDADRNGCDQAPAAELRDERPDPQRREHAGL